MANLNIQSPRRIVRFIASDDHKANTPLYGVLNDDQEAKPGTKVSLLNYQNIYDPSTYHTTSIQATISKLLTPIDAVNIFCIGLNYQFHAKESSMKLPEYPVIFTKPTSSVIAANEDIIVPSCCVKGDNGEMDYEVEMVVVIGKKCKNVTEKDALNYVLGYSVANDVSARKWQLEKGGSQWIRGKSFDTFCPFGPCLLLQNEKTMNAQNMRLYTELNGKILQNSNTKEMIFGIRKLISFLSMGTTLLPGTIILSGTPDGVGFARKPPVVLKHGDVVTVAVDGIGKLTNNVRDAQHSML